MRAVSTAPGEVPPPPSQAVGQQTAPSTIVPHTPHIKAVPTNGLAMVSLVTGILSYIGHIIPLIGGGTLALIAIVTGYIARRQIAQSGEQGKDAATIGIVLGAINIGIVLLIVLVLLFFFFVLGISLFTFAAHSGG
jgi:hypothetical protein